MVQDTFETLERGDIAEALNAAAQIGDDALAHRVNEATTAAISAPAIRSQRRNFNAPNFNRKSGA